MKFTSNQRDDTIVQKRSNGEDVEGNMTCSPNALAMKLLTLADGDEELVKREALRIAEDNSLGTTIKLELGLGIALFGEQ